MARPTRRLGNLPAEATSFVGRRRELAELRKKLSAARLVSLVGPGGVGKTRLAIRIATDLQRGFAGGAWLVELAELHDPTFVPNAIMAALDLRDQASSKPRALVLSYLREKELLLVIDNCEHLLQATAEVVAEIVKAAPGVRVLATTRYPLSLPAEHVIPVPPLEHPPVRGEAGFDQLRQNEPLVLFTERAAAASGKFELTATNSGAVIDLCRRLDGLPLAIELAAVRTRLLSVEQILDRLTDRFALLTGGGRAAIPRHQTLRATIDWSRNLLEPAEQALLSRLCVFAGRFTLDDAEAVCTFGDVSGVKAIDLLASLVDKSLVMKEDARGFASYRLHETMREYASGMLQEGGERDVLEARFADYYISKCQPSVSKARFALLEWLAWIDLEIDNVRSILRRCVIQGDFERGVALAGSLLWYWTTRATTEGARWLDDLLVSGSGNPGLQARACFIRGFLAVLQSDPTAARPALQRAVAAARKAELQTLLSHSLSMASIAENIAGNRAAARRLFEQAAVVTTAVDDVGARLTFLQAQALNGLFEGDLEAVFSASSEGVRLSRQAGDIYSLQMMLVNFGCAGIMAGDLDPSKQQLVEALEIARQVDDRVAQFYVLEALVCHAAASGRARLAARLLGASEALRAAAGGSIMASLAPLLDKAEQAAIAALGDSKFEAEVAAGRGLSRDAAMTLALGESPQPVAAASADTGAELLGKRQAQVADLIAEGLSNKQIAARLFISEYTVDSHVRSVLNKLGFNSRAQIARWTASNQER